MILDGCNECGGGGLTESFVMPTVASVDQSRAVWPSCPASGWASGVDRLTSRPNGKQLVMGVGPGTLRPAWPANEPVKMPAESHGGYVGLGGGGAGHLGEGRPTDVTGTFAPVMMPTNPNPSCTGPDQMNWYKSEFGCVAWSSFESISAQLPPDQWSLNSDSAYYRNWPVDLVIHAYFGEHQDLNATGEVAFKKQLYQSMLGQALNHKATIESWRATNVFGTTIWMYNELWPTGGWGSVEYGGNTTGQIAGGRWKTLQYFFEASIFADQMATCTSLGACFVKNDAPTAFDGSVVITLLNVLSGKSAQLTNHDVSMPPGAGSVEWFCPADKDELRGEQSAGAYAKHRDQIPIDRGNFTKVASGAAGVCEAACNADKSCKGCAPSS